MKGLSFLLRPNRVRVSFPGLTENLTEAGELLPVAIGMAALDFPSS